MNSKKLLALYGLKWNPFSPELPSEALLATPKIEHFAWRVEQLVQEGGFALVTGESGTGKSVALRIVAGRLSALRDVMVGVIERPQSKSADFYRELGDIFAVKLAPHNRWGGFKAGRKINFDKLVLVIVAENAMTCACKMQRLRHGFAASFVWSPSNWTSGDGDNGRRRKLGMSAGAGFRWWLEPPDFRAPRSWLD
jgi:hypothetical protein